jgi:hypothetical protein
MFYIIFSTFYCRFKAIHSLLVSKNNTKFHINICFIKILAVLLRLYKKRHICPTFYMNSSLPECLVDEKPRVVRRCLGTLHRVV